MWHAWERNVYRILMGKPEGRRSIGRPRRRWEDGIRIHLRKFGLEWTQLAPVADLVNAVKTLGFWGYGVT
jgi:hypothetical protein